MRQDAPGLVGDVARWIDDCSIHSAPVLSCAAALVTVAAVVGRRYECDGARAPLYVVGVAKSGVGKDVGRRCATGLLEAAGLGDRIGTDDVASAAGIVTRLRGSPTQLFLLDEFGRLLEAYTSHGAGSHEREIVTTLMKLWSSAGSTYQGKAYADAKSSKRVVEPCCVLYGTTTPDVFYRALRGSDVVDGVLSRVLLVQCDHGQMPPRRPSCRPSDPPAELVLRAKRIARGRAEGNLAAVDTADLRAPLTELPLTDDARVALGRIGEVVRPQLDGRHAELWVRAREQSLRVALVVAAGCEAERVEVEHLAWAWRYVRWCIARSVKVVETRVADTDEGQCALSILELLERRESGAATMGEITRHAARWGRRVRMDSLAALVDTGSVDRTVVPTRGRPVVIYVLTRTDDTADVAPWLTPSPTTVGEVLTGSGGGE